MNDVVAHMQRTLRTEARAVSGLADHLADQSEPVLAACSTVLRRCGESSPGRLVVSGVGKAGLVGRKIAATFASTGTPAIFLHPAEALHGDLGMVRRDDVCLLLSNSGSSDEITALLPHLALIGCPLIAFVGRTDSPLARYADHIIDIGSWDEACPLGLAPSTSTTVMLALGDALALSVQDQRDFSAEDYARFHPGGALGRKLMTCNEAMRPLPRIATAHSDTPVHEALHIINRARCGSAVIVDQDNKLLGILTDGDIRRIFTDVDDPTPLLHGPVHAVATMPCTAIHGDDLLAEAIRLCGERKVSDLPVTDAQHRVIGLIDLQDLAHRGFDI